LARKILITGATGTVGGALLRTLHGSMAPGEVVAATRNPAKLVDVLPRACITAMDFDSPETLPPALEGVDALFLMTGYSVAMLLQSKMVLDAAAAAGVRHVVHLGAWGSERSRFQHLVWHDFVERYIQSAGFTWTHLQPKTFMRNVLTALRPGSTTIRQFYGRTVVGWIDPDDIAAVAAACLAQPEVHAGRTYRLAQDALSVDGVAQVLTQETGLAFTHEPRDPRELGAILAKAGMEAAYGQSLAESTVAIANGQVPGIAQVYDTVRDVTGRPGTTWREYARRHREAIIQRATSATR